jgi:hypothetical protein
MELISTRRWYTPTSTISELRVNGTKECYVLEDAVRAAGVKIVGKTAIPAGRYQVTVDWSNRFQKYALHILDVPNFAGIRIHSGNTDKDTDGCLLVGQERALNAVFKSRDAFAAVWAKLTEAAPWDGERDCQAFRMKEETWITIVDSPESDTRDA